MSRVVTSVVTMMTTASAATKTAATTGAPWANSALAARVVAVIAEPRSASTEVAEAIAQHPCGYSFNEVFGHDRTPTYYEQYSQERMNLWRYLEGGSTDELWQTKHNHMMEFLLEARTNFCAARDDAVLEICGKVCVVAVKIHSHMVKKAGSLESLLASNETRAIVLHRDPATRQCSVNRSMATHQHPHSPEQYAQLGDEHAVAPCATTATPNFVKSQERYYDRVRRCLRDNDKALSLEISFEWYASTGQPANNDAVRAFAGLHPFPVPAWSGTCTEYWCERLSWPIPLKGTTSSRFPLEFQRQ